MDKIGRTSKIDSGKKSNALSALTDDQKGLLLLLLSLFFIFGPILFTGTGFKGTDDFDLHLFFTTVLSDSLLNHQALPLWCHHINGGYPIYANPEFPFPNLLILPGLLLGTVIATKLHVFLWILFAAVSFFRLTNKVFRIHWIGSVLLTLILFTSPWTKTHFITGGDLNDYAPFLIVIFMDIFFQVFHPKELKDSRSITQAIQFHRQNTLTKAGSIRLIFLLIFLTGTAFSSGKGHLIYYYIFASIFTLCFLFPAFIKKNGHFIFMLLFVVIILCGPVILMHSKIISVQQANILDGLRNPFQFDLTRYAMHKGIVTTFEPLINTFRSLYKPAFGFLIIFLAGIIANLIRRRYPYLIVMLLLAILFCQGEMTVFGRYFFANQITFHTLSRKYFDFYLHLFLILNMIPLIQWIVRKKIKTINLILPLLCLLLVQNGVRNIENFQTKKFIDQHSSNDFFHISSPDDKKSYVPLDFYKSNIGVLNWKYYIVHPTQVIPKMYYTNKDNSLSENGRFEPNPEYPGEGYFTNPENRVIDIRHGQNEIDLSVIVSSVPSNLTININGSKYWQSDLGNIQQDQTGRIEIMDIPTGSHSIHLQYVPKPHHTLMLRDMLVMTALLLLYLAGSMLAFLRSRKDRTGLKDNEG